MKREYEALLNHAEKGFETFSLVWRDDFQFDNSAREIEKALIPYLIETKQTNEWPGTKLFSGTATIKIYKVTPESIAILKAVGSVFDWLAPAYPEDLTFYKGGRPIYVSISHEKDAWYEES